MKYPIIKFDVTTTEHRSFTHPAGGRERWALERLDAAGERGCTPITEPAPRWAHYVWLLREAGIEVETINEPHGGKFAGTHARYVLRSEVTSQAHGEVA